MIRILSTLALATLACAAGGIDCSSRHSDGSSECTHDVAASDLRGRWCDPRPGYDLCLVVLDKPRYPDETLYIWEASDCHEYGRLTGNVMFEPASNPESACYSPLDNSHYGASIHFTETGIEVAIHGPVYPVQLDYVRGEQ